jgi:hypothetical protein
VRDLVGFAVKNGQPPAVKKHEQSSLADRCSRKTIRTSSVFIVSFDLSAEKSVAPSPTAVRPLVQAPEENNRKIFRDFSRMAE